jgi:hypothetical protein
MAYIWSQAVSVATHGEFCLSYAVKGRYLWGKALALPRLVSCQLAGWVLLGSTQPHIELAGSRHWPAIPTAVAKPK